MKTKVRRKMSWDEHGVSEIIADILILAMTVVLFAVIFAFVWSMPAPNEATYADMEGSIQLDATGGRIFVTHLSGEDLRDTYTEIYLYKTPCIAPLLQVYPQQQPLLPNPRLPARLIV